MAPVAAAAPPLSPIVDRGYDVDLFVGPAVGSPRTLAMGGTHAASSEGASGLLGNPGASAVRPLGARSTWDWDGTVSGFVPDIGSDFDNNGRDWASTSTAHVGTIGLLGFHDSWALGIGATDVTYRLAPPSRDPLDLRSAVARVVVARGFWQDALSVGLGLRLGSFSISKGDEAIFSVGGAGLETGVLYGPRAESFRVGLRFGLPVHGTDVKSACNPNDCAGYILPERAEAPWELGAGFAWRKAPSAWNGETTGPFRDESALVVSADLLVSGRVARGAGIEAFSEGLLQPSGRSVSVSLRAGAEKEWLPGRLRVRGGAYWEPGRFTGVDGRAHATAGLELRLFAFSFWDVERRVAISIAGDVARRYGNVGVSFGFWH